MFTPRVSNSVLSYKTKQSYRPSPKNRRFFNRRSTNGVENTNRKSLGVYSPDESPRRVNNKSVEPRQSGI